MSSLAKACPHCHEPVGELSESEREKLAMRRWRDRIYRARNLTYVAMTLVVAGLIAWFVAEPRGLALPIGMFPGVLLGVGLIGYVASWGWLAWIKFREDPRRQP
ncbi:MAG: hypothetical protein ACNS61_11530 [Candidatus Wenzhouxiangella sp. M2_3B_020]